jgi:hypothetical protein
MTWNANQSQQQNGNGQQFQRRIPDPGKGRLRMVDKARARDASKAPDFRGLINCDGHLIEVSIWHNPAKQGPSGMMPESFSASVRTFDPNQQGQGQQQPAQQQMPYAPPQQTTPQYVPQPQYAPSPQPPQNGGYAPAPGYHPPQQGQPPMAPQPPRWGGGPGQTMQASAAQGGGIPRSDIPF